MSTSKFRQWLILFLLLTVAIPCAGYAQGTADKKQIVQAPLRDRTAIMERRLHKTTQEQREEAADRLAAARQTALATEGLPAKAPIPPAPYDVPDYFGVANWANSPPLRKFIDPLPSLPVAVADNVTYPGSDYYEISLRQYSQQLHADLPPTTLRGYVQTNKGTDGAGQNTINPPPIQYLGPLVIAKKNRPVRIKFTNELPTGTDGNLFIPVDNTTMGAGAGPDGNPYPQNRAVLHLHGGKTPWISDGTPHQWITPAGELSTNNRGVSAVNVPDMPDPGAGSMTYYYSNQQSARLLWIHDHSWGITRLNVYAGEAMGYLLEDDTEKELLTAGLIPSDQIPLIIQDKSFVEAATVRTTDPTWNWGTGAPVGGVRPPVEGDLWYPHVYVPAQNPFDISGVNPWGRWPYGPWFWPPTIVPNMPVPNPYADQPGQPPEIPGTPHPSAPGESFMDTAMVNGVAFPTHTVAAKPYRLRILNAANDRFLNLQWYVADDAVTSSDGRENTEVKMVPAVTTSGFPELWPTDNREGGVPDPATVGPSWIMIGTEGGFLPEPVVVPNQPINWNTDPTTFNAGNVSDHSLLLGPAERGDVIVDFSAYAGKTLILYNDAPAAFPALDARYDYYTGAPDMTDTGGHSGPQVGFGPNIRTVMQIKVNAGGGQPFNLTALQNAFKTTGTADGVFKKGQDPIIVGQTAYNAVYDKTFPTTFPNWGVSRIQDNSLSFQTINGTILTIPLQPKAIQDEMGEAFDEYGRLNSKLGLEMSMTTAGTQTFTLQNFVDPATEIIDDCVVTGVATAGDGTQIWKITHNGVDTHPVHFHLYDVQLINRVGWDGAIRLPHPTELGWKDTVRISPLEDTIIALRAVSPKQPFGLPDSLRPFNPQEPIGSTTGFTAIDPLTGQPRVTPVVNVLTNFGWEYVFHCHILSHEEMDMMRPVVFNVARALPDAPVLSAPQNTGTQVELTWTDATPPVPAYGEPGTFWGNPQGEIGFRIERSSGGGFIQIGTALANQITYADNSSLGSGNYTYRVIAYNAAGDSVSNETSVNTTTVSPGAPTVLTATAVAPQQIDLAWVDNANNENGFRIERATGAGAFSPLTTLLPNTTAFSDTTAASETTYSYRVFAYNDAGDSLPSNTATATTPPTLPAAPTGLGATAINAHQVNLAWTDTATNEAGFRIERATGAGAFAALATVGANVTAYSDTTAAAGTTYNYRVFAYNVTGDSAASNTATATTPALPPTTGATVSPAPNGAGWHNSNPTVTISAVANGGSGFASITYSATGAGAIGSTTVTSSPVAVVISTEGTTTLSYYATDNLGNQSTPQSVTVKLDKTTPNLVWGAKTPAANSFGWNNASVSISWTASDATSGIVSPGTSGTLNFTSEGANQNQTVTLVDAAGNSKSFASPWVSIDTTAPTAGATSTPAPNAGGWNNSNATMNISAADGVSGINTITYSTSGATNTPATTVFGSTASVIASAEGTTTLTYYAVDYAGNQSVQKTLTIKLDKTAPSLTWGAKTPAANGFGWNNTAVTIPFTATDGLSGITSPGPRGAIRINSEGANQSLSITMLDAAGNSKTYRSPTASIDTVAPNVSAAASPGTARPRLLPVSVTVSGTISDATSGLNTGSCKYTVVDSEGRASSSGAVSVAANGSYSFSLNLPAMLLNSRSSRQYTITVKGADKAGNSKSAVTTFTVRR